MAAWFVYVLRCCDGTLYTGISTDVARRVAHHNAGRGAKYTRARRPVEIVYSERKRTQSTALRREAAIKALPREAKLALVAAKPAAAEALATKPSTTSLGAGERPSPGRPRSTRAPSTKAALLLFWAMAVVAPLTQPRAEEGTNRVLVPAGPFMRGSIHGEEDERPVRTVVVPAFFIDRFETTRAAYAKCVAAKSCRPLPPPFRGRGKEKGAPAGEGTLPVVGVSWFDAQDYCRFAGGRLPREDEWEKAARGADGREYPWGGTLDCQKANWGNQAGEGPCAGINPGRPVAVGSYPAGASPHGVEDLGGNVWEWTADVYDEEDVAPAGAASKDRRRVVRGGSCCSERVGPRAANRNAWEPRHRDGDLGFRCVHPAKAG